MNRGQTKDTYGLSRPTTPRTCPLPNESDDTSEQTAAALPQGLAAGGCAELQQAREQLGQAQRVSASFVARITDAATSLQDVEHHLQSIAKTKPYRLAHFLWRLERDFVKGTWKDRKAFLIWLVRRLGGRQVPIPARRNPLLTWPATSKPGPNHEEQLLGILQKHRGKPIIVFRPIVEWNLPLFQRPHHLARQLASQGFLYFFCTPKWGKDVVNGFEEVGPGCYVTDQFLLLETLTGRITHLYSTDNACDLEYVRFRQSAGDLVVYEYIDHIHEAISGKAIPEATWTRHRALLEDQTVVCIATADRLYSEVGTLRSRNIALVTNGVDISHFAVVPDRAQDVPDRIQAIVRKNKPIIGYFGALASWFDYALVERAARERPGYEWLLIGVNYDGSIERTRLGDLPNVTLLGPIPYNILPRYASRFDVSTIPFALNEITLSTSPIKLFEYMALGKPIVTTALPECRKYRSCLVADSADQFLLLLDRALDLRNSTSYLATLREEAQENSWQKKGRAIAEVVQRNLEARPRLFACDVAEHQR